MLRRKDADSGEPIRASSDSGTNSARTKDVISIECDNSHYYQRVEGCNSKGLRSVQEAEWPRDACKRILSASIKELDDRSCRVAFAGEIMKKDRQELGPLDVPEEDADDTPPPIGTNLSKVAEDEMEFLDSLKIEGFPEGEAQRRKAWIELPRATRAAIRRMHHLIGHKSHSVLVHLLRGARDRQEAHRRSIEA